MKKTNLALFILLIILYHETHEVTPGLDLWQDTYNDGIRTKTTSVETTKEKSEKKHESKN